MAHPHYVADEIWNARAAEILAEKRSVWIFGFGSLVHTPGFPYDARVHGFVRGWRRVWWQGSTDHRGTPEHPGRTVTLVAEPGAVAWGTAYRLTGTPEEQLSTLAYLEWREKQYDLRIRVDVFDSEDSWCPTVLAALCYVATSRKALNPNFLGPAPSSVLAVQIATAHGPSGRNYEYLFHLADALRSMGASDDQVFELEGLVKKVLTFPKTDLINSETKK